MAKVAVIGIGQTPAGEHGDKSARELAIEALRAALRDAHVDQVDALYVGNMLGGELSRQENLGALMAEALGMHGIPAFRVESASGSSAAALHAGYLAIAAGQSDRVAVVDVEKMTDLAPRAVMQALASSGNRIYQAAHGFSFDSLNALWLRRYMYEFDRMEEDLACFTLNVHSNGQYNPYAMFHRPVTLETYIRARKLADPISLLDAAPVYDDVAAVILSRGDRLNGNRARTVTVPLSSIATDTPSLCRPRDRS